MDLINGQRKKSHYEAVYGGYVKTQRMIRKDGYKLMVYPKLKKVLLFDMVNDPQEMNDLASDDEFHEKAKEMFHDLIQLQKKMNDSLDLRDIYGDF
jgi:arylsulfatase A-like enzyme